MNEIADINYINENNLNNKNYFQSLLKEGYAAKVIKDSEIERIQIELLNVITKQINRYTSNESSSVRTEKAQQIFESICYCIGAYLKTVPGVNHQIELLKPDNIENLFVSGIDTVKLYLAKSTVMIADIQKEALEINNLAYINTIFHGIPDYIRDYDVKYAAQEEGGSIDYPLAIDITDLTGFEYMNEYLIRLTMENSFCKKFSDKTIEQLFMSYNKDYPDLLINMYEIIFTNALGLILLHKDFYQLDISERDRNTLQTKLAGSDVNKLQDNLRTASELLYSELNLMNTDLLTYMKKTVVSLSQRLVHLLEMNKLEMIFISFENAVLKVEPYYQDGQLMADDELRKFINEIQECRDISDKIALIQRDIHSLRDLIEVMDLCIYDDEFVEVFRLLSDSEISALLSFINEKDDKEWQIALKKYINNR